MKLTAYLLFSIFFVFMSCKKTEEKAELPQSVQYRYVAFDNTSANVKFIDDKGKKSIEITSNKNTISLPKTDQDSVYTNADIKATFSKDSLTIVQGNNIINLKKAKGQK